MNTFHKRITVRFTDRAAHLTLAQVADRACVDPARVVDALDRLVERGYLTPRPDGTYDATIPMEGPRA